MPRSRKAKQSRRSNLQIAREELALLRQRRSRASSASERSDNSGQIDAADNEPESNPTDNDQAAGQPEEKTTRPAAPSQAVDPQPQPEPEPGGTQTVFRLNVPPDFRSASSGESMYLKWSLSTSPGTNNNAAFNHIVLPDSKSADNFNAAQNSQGDPSTNHEGGSGGERSG